MEQSFPKPLITSGFSINLGIQGIKLSFLSIMQPSLTYGRLGGDKLVCDVMRQTKYIMFQFNSQKCIQQKMSSFSCEARTKSLLRLLEQSHSVPQSLDIINISWVLVLYIWLKCSQNNKTKLLPVLTLIFTDNI